MGKRHIFLLFILIILLLSVLTPIKTVLAVSAVPNQSVVIGKVVKCSITSSSVLNIEPDQKIYSITLNVESSEGVYQGTDFLDDNIGEYVRFFSKSDLSRNLFGRKVKAIVSFKGDERGGKFWIVSIEVIE